MLIVFCDFLHNLTQDMFVIVDDFADHKLNIANLKKKNIQFIVLNASNWPLGILLG